MNKQLTTPLYDVLIEHVKKNPVSFHVPGHKNGVINQPEANLYFNKVFQMDATELSGLDDLHSPEGAILEAESLLSDLYQTKESYFLVNGSTAGNLAMIMAVCEEGKKVLVQRNCHKSILNGLILAKADPVFIEPEFNQEWMVPTGISFETVKEAIDLYPEACALILTYPNYYGMGSDVEKIIKEAHLHHIPVVVDEAHGPHFILGDPFPTSALLMGADLVVQSAHKTLPAMTMGSFLHVNSSLIKPDKVKEYLAMFQSSSPSYPIMASLDLARKYLATYKTDDLSYLLSKLNYFKEGLATIPAIKVLEYANDTGDPLKITIQSRCGLSGFDLQSRLEQVSIFTELADPQNVLFIFPLLKEGQSFPVEETVSNIKEVLADLTMIDIQEKLALDSQKISTLALSFNEMVNLEVKDVHISAAAGEVAGETIIPYPPGIPLLLKGERITSEKLDQLNRLLKSGARFQGGSLLKNGRIKTFCTA